MAANNLGTAYIKIAPQMDGIQSSISNGLAKIKSTSLPGAAALGTVIAKGISTAMDAVTNSLDRAISRVDTLNAFPKIMKNLGFSTEESTSAITKLSDRIEGLPTGLDEIVNYTQRLASTMGNLNDGMYSATNLAIAFNDAALAGGKGQFEANRAFEQFSQVLSRGRPSMQDWKIMMEVMPGQLKQMAKYMGVNNKSLQEYAKQAGKTVDQLDGMDLYEWISEDKNEHAKERLGDLTKALIDLDNKGGAGITSFKDQVGDATHTIGNALGLIPLRISKAMATVIEAFGQGDIYKAIDKFSSSFKGIGDWIAKNIVPVIKNNVIPVIKTLLNAVKSVVEFIASNKWVQNFLKDVLLTLLAYKGILEVTAIVKTFSVAIVGLATNISTAATTFSAARAAGLTFSTSMGAAAGATTGLTSAVTGLLANLGKIALVAGVAVLAIKSIEAITIANETAQIKAQTAARNYARHHYDLEQATKSAAEALKIQKQATEDLKNAQDAANNAEIAAIQARKDQITYQQEMNRLKAEGKENTDDYRLAELQYTQAIEAEKVANNDLKKAQEDVAKTKQDLDNLASSEIYKANYLIGTVMKEQGEYGNLAAKLDELKNTTIKYQDAQGNMVEMSVEKSKEMVDGIAEQLAAGNETWRKIVDLANTEGISFAEACAKYGKEGGEGLTGNFTTSIDKNLDFVTGTTKKIGEQSIQEMMIEANKSNLVGENLISGIQKGVNSKQGGLFGSLNRMMQNALQTIRDAAVIKSPSHKTAEMGKYIVLGLAKGIDDYADEAISSAENMTEKTIAAMNSSMGINGNLSQYQPENGITSGMNGLGGQVTQYNNFTVNDNLDVNEISKRLGWQVATAL